MQIDDEPVDVTEVLADIREAKSQDRKVRPGTARTLAKWLADLDKRCTALKALALGEEVDARAVLRDLRNVEVTGRMWPRENPVHYQRPCRELVIFIPSKELKRS